MAGKTSKSGSESKPVSLKKREPALLDESGLVIVDEARTKSTSLIDWLEGVIERSEREALKARNNSKHALFSDFHAVATIAKGIRKKVGN